MQNEFRVRLRTLGACLAVAFLATTLPLRMVAQDQDQEGDDPPSRAARLGHIEGSVSFQPAGESEWVEAAPNRPMTTGDKLWADRDSRTEVELGSTSIRLNANTGISFLNLDDRTVQVQLSSGAINVRVRRLSHDDVFEIDTPNQAFSVFRPGLYRVEASEDGSNTVVTVREGEGESTGNGQTYTVHEGQQATFSGTERLNADVQQVGEPDGFDRWSNVRDRRFEDSRSAHYVSRDVVGSEDLDEYGDWEPSEQYGHVWYPRVAADWAPYHAGHWAWIDPWGWTWVDDAPWGYAPFHYGRWAFVGHRWGWVPGPVDVRPVYAPALVVFVGGRGPAFGGNVAWFPLGPREVYVPSYHVSPAYVNRVNVSNTTVNQTTVTNVYNTTVINNNSNNTNTTVVNNVTYANRNVSGAVTAVPQSGFAGGQSVSRIAVPVDRHQLAAAQVSTRVAVAPSQSAVLGTHVNAANRVSGPPQAVFNRAVIAKTAPPPAPVSFAAKQQELAAHPGQPMARQEMQRLRTANAPAAQPLVRQAPPGRPVLVNTSGPGNRPLLQPVSQPANPRADQPGNRPANQPSNEWPGANRGQPNRPSEPNRASEPPARNDRPAAAQPNNRPESNAPASNHGEASRPSEGNRPSDAPARNDRPVAAQPNNRPESNAPAPNRGEANRPSEGNRPSDAPTRNDRPAPAQPINRPESNTSVPNRGEANRPSEGNRPSDAPARNDRPVAAQPTVNQPVQPSQPSPAARPAEHSRQENAPARQENPPSAARPQPQQQQQQAQPQPHPQSAPQAHSDDKKHSDDARKQDQKPH